MAKAQLDELLKDELAGEQRIGSWEYMLQVLFTHPDASSLSRYRIGELREDGRAAQTNLSFLLARASETGMIRKIDPTGELAKFEAGLVAANEALARQATQSEVYRGLSEAVDEEVFQLLDRQQRLSKSIGIQIAETDFDIKSSLCEALSELEQALELVGSERCSHLHAARSQTNRIQAMPYGERCALASLVGAIAEWKLTRSIDETQRILRRIVQKSDENCSLIAYLATRMLGNLEWGDESLHSAWTLLARSDECEKDPDLLIERCRLALRLGKAESAAQIAKRGLEMSDLFLIRLLAISDIEKIAPDVLALIVERQKAVRQLTEREMSAWAGEIRQIRKIKKFSGFDFPFLEIGEANRLAFAPRVGEADIFLSLYLIQQIRNERHEALRLTREAVLREHELTSKLLLESKAHIAQAWVERDAMVDAAVREQKLAADRTREALRKSLFESERNQMGCVTGFGSGCGAFLLYLVIAAVLSTQGIQAGYGTIFGWFGLAAAGVPILFAIVAQISYGVQRATLDAALHEKIKATQIAYEAAVKKADRFCRDKVLNLRDGLPDLEARAHRAEEALKLINAFGEALPTAS